jgi:hypothetical protein
VKSLVQAVVAVVVAALLGVALPWSPQGRLGVAGVVILGSVFLLLLSTTIAGITPAHLGPDHAVLLVPAVLGIAAASSLLGRPAR